MFVLVLKFTLFVIIGLILVYTIRHYTFTLNRLFGRQRHPYINIDTASWPNVTVLVAAHNEEAVIENSIEALLRVNYPSNKFKIMIANDRSTDRTAEIIDDFAARYPEIIKVLHRKENDHPGKASALRDATQYIDSEIIIIFDADYIPGLGLIKQLAAPFFDPEVGLVMGRVVPVNTGYNLLTRLLDLERAGGYQVDQQARMNLGLVPQYGGTVGGVRRAALESVGGWLEDTLAEDTDITYRTILKGWKSVYQNHSECYEEAPETWPVRMNQITRWAKGHNQSMCRYTFQCFATKKVSLSEKIDSILLLGVYMMSPIVMLGWTIAILLFYMGENNLLVGSLALFAITAFGTIGNFAAFFEITSAVHLDGGKKRVLLLPFNLFNFLISAVTVSIATIAQLLSGANGCHPRTWVKTPRFRDNNFVIEQE